MKSLKDILDIVCQHYNVTATKMRSSLVHKSLKIPRNTYCHVCKLYDHTQVDIGVYLGGRNKSFVSRAQGIILDSDGFDAIVKKLNK